jgi:hypothetical protein
MIHPRVHLYRRLFVILLWLMAIVLMLALTITHNPPAELRAMAAHWAEEGHPATATRWPPAASALAPLIPVEVETAAPAILDSSTAPSFPCRRSLRLHH